MIQFRKFQDRKQIYHLSLVTYFEETDIYLEQNLSVLSFMGIAIQDVKKVLILYTVLTNVVCRFP